MLLQQFLFYSYLTDFNMKNYPSNSIANNSSVLKVKLKLKQYLIKVHQINIKISQHVKLLFQLYQTSVYINQINHKFNLKIQRNQTMFLLTLILLLPFTCSFYTFTDFKNAFNKNYQSSSQQQTREGYFDNIVVAAQALLDSGVSYNIAENSFWDKSPQQISKLSNSVKQLTNPSQDSYNDFKTGGNDQNTVENITQINWKSQGKVTAISNQQQCGSAWAFAVTAMCESSLILKQQQQQDLSEQKIFSCTSESSCSGGYIQYALQTVINNGIPLEQQYSYQPDNTSSSICNNTDGLIYPALSFYQFYDLNDEQILGLLKYGPIITHLSAQNWLYYDSGIFECQSDSPIGHAGLIVGVTNSYWLIKNSWGSDWGESGYIRISRQSGKNCGIGSAVYALYENRVFVYEILLMIIVIALL